MGVAGWSAYPQFRLVAGVSILRQAALVFGIVDDSAGAIVGKTSGFCESTEITESTVSTTCPNW